MTRPPKATEVTTASCRRLSLNLPKPQHININDIAHHLATINRFCGAPPVPYSVAQHCVVVAEQLMHDTKAALYGLLHDAHEAYIGDVFGPFDAQLSTCSKQEISYLKRDLDECIFAAFHLPPPDPQVVSQVNQADLIALQTEFRDIMPDGAVPPNGPAPLRKAIKALPWPKAEESFLNLWRKLAQLNGLQEAIR